MLRRGRAWFTDKMPLNETHLGLIALLFPEAPLIHVLRHPLDIMRLGLLQPSHPRVLLRLRRWRRMARHYVRVMDLVRALPRAR